jgi:prefoldin alpha subunit
MAKQTEGAEDRQKDLTQVAIELNYYRQQAEEIQRQLASLQALSDENGSALEALKNLPQEGKETMVPIGSGVLLKANVADSKKVFAEVGARVLAEKTIEEAASLVEEKQKNVETALGQLQSSLETVMQRIEFLGRKARELQGR